MPLPSPRKGEEQSHFVSRCISFETKASPGRDPEQIQAMCFQAWRDRDVGQMRQALGEGRGQGGPRQGIGGAKYCRCLKCGHEMEHNRNTPCQEIKCPKCGSSMIGTNVKKG